MSDHAEIRTETNLAWFKLAELIARKEREKALNVYRLLSHSLEDKAFALQVEGDILRSFEMRDSVEKYQQSAFLYTQERRWVNAIGIYEHLLSRDQNNLEFIIALVDLYAKLDWEEKCKNHIAKLFPLLTIHKPELERTYKTIQQTMRQNNEKTWFKAYVQPYKDNFSEQFRLLIF